MHQTSGRAWQRMLSGRRLATRPAVTLFFMIPTMVLAASRSPMVGQRRMERAAFIGGSWRTDALDLGARTVAFHRRLPLPAASTRAILRKLDRHRAAPRWMQFRIPFARVGR